MTLGGVRPGLRGGALLAVLSIAACAPTAQLPPPGAALAVNPSGAPLPHILTVQGPWRHAASGMLFPTSVDAFDRVSVIQYDRDGLNVSAGYNLSAAPPRIVATVYVYPAPAVPGTREAACRREFAAAIAEIRRTYQDVTLVEERDVAHRQGATLHPGHLARFTYQTTFGGTAQPLASSLHLFCHVGGRWQVKYRVTHPIDLAAEPQIDAFMQGLAWTVGGERAAHPHSADPSG